MKGHPDIQMLYKYPAKKRSYECGDYRTHTLVLETITLSPTVLSYWQISPMGQL